MSVETGGKPTLLGGDQAAFGWDAPFKVAGIPEDALLLQLHHDSDQIGQAPPLPGEIFKQLKTVPPAERSNAFYLGPERSFPFKSEIHGPQWFAFTDIMPFLTASGMGPQSAIKEYSGLLIEEGQGIKDLDGFLSRLAGMTKCPKEDLWLRLTSGNWIGGGPVSETTQAIQTLQWKDMSHEGTKTWQEGKSFYNADIVPEWVSNMQSSVVENGAVNKGPVQQVLYGLWQTLGEYMSGDQLFEAQKRFAELFGRNHIERTFAQLGITPETSASDVINRFMDFTLQKYPDIYDAKNVSLSHTTKEFQIDQSGQSMISPYFDLWVHSYSSIAHSYNAALEKCGSGMSPLNQEKGELPFFVIDLDTGLKEKIHMTSGTLQIGEQRKTYPMRPFAEIQELFAKDRLSVVPATLALAHVLDGQAQLVLPEEGSHYSEAGKEYETWINEISLIEPQVLPLPALTQAGITPHPLLRVNPRALERIPDEMTLQLPDWIQRSVRLVDTQVGDTVSGEYMRTHFQEWRDSLDGIYSALNTGFDNFFKLLESGQVTIDQIQPWIQEWQQRAGIDYGESWEDSVNILWQTLRDRRGELKSVERSLDIAQTLGSTLENHINSRVASALRTAAALYPHIDIPPVNAREILYSQDGFVEFFTKMGFPLREFDNSFVNKCLVSLDFSDAPDLQKMKDVLLNPTRSDDADFEEMFGINKSESGYFQKALDTFFQKPTVLSQMHRFVSIHFAEGMVEEQLKGVISDHIISESAQGRGLPSNLIVDKRYTSENTWQDMSPQERDGFVGNVLRAINKQIKKNKPLEEIPQLSHLTPEQRNQLIDLMQNASSDINPQRTVQLKQEIQGLEDQFALQVLYPMAMIKRDVSATSEALRYFNHRPWALLVHMMSPDWYRNIAENTETYEQHMRATDAFVQEVDVSGNKLVMMEDKGGVFSQANHPQRDRLEAVLRHQAIKSGSDTAIVLTYPDDLAHHAKMVVIEKNGDHSNFCGNAAKATGLLYKNWMEQNGGSITVENVRGDQVAIDIAASGEMAVALPMKELSDDAVMDTVNARIAHVAGIQMQGIYTAASEPHVVLDCSLFSGDIEQLKNIAHVLQSEVPGGINVNFVLQSSEDMVEARVYERGVNDWTGSCGTGASSIGYAYGIEDGHVTFLKEKERHETKVRRYGEAQMQLVTERADMHILHKQRVSLEDPEKKVRTVEVAPGQEMTIQSFDMPVWRDMQDGVRQSLYHLNIDSKTQKGIGSLLEKRYGSAGLAEQVLRSTKVHVMHGQSGDLIGVLSYNQSMIGQTPAILAKLHAVEDGNEDHARHLFDTMFAEDARTVVSFPDSPSHHVEFRNAAERHGYIIRPQSGPVSADLVQHLEQVLADNYVQPESIDPESLSFEHNGQSYQPMVAIKSK